jgi:signal transduction histidine kinase
VSDDGTGDPEHVRRALRVAAASDLNGSHRGLVNMAERAREIGGTLRIRRSPQGGIRIEVGVPLPLPAGVSPSGAPDHSEPGSRS